ncbi:hypothetical protein E4L96_16200 [Massilia arenosa]|uniref:DUF6973 domain-containing protein n=1 Tax=Zemynaea arenosa TaxID=2561931 RepID=A0A4Y9S4S3_9BURK|nr:hypothetical protein [Massilia arenosa]TFW16537.1 hypothetical protein E4L96_16200 [Massilia arenosa]
MLSRDVGIIAAIKITMAHEDTQPNPLGEREMDEHNNRVGMKLGLMGGTDIQLSEQSYSALKGQQLKVLEKK